MWEGSLPQASSRAESLFLSNLVSATFMLGVGAGTWRCGFWGMLERLLLLLLLLARRSENNCDSATVIWVSILLRPLKESTRLDPLAGRPKQHNQSLIAPAARNSSKLTL
jgi:hypothetical protein